MSAAAAPAFVICPDCDTVYRDRSLGQGEVSLCVYCDAVLARHYSTDVDEALALVIACAIFFVVVNVAPILAVEVGGIRTEVNIWSAPSALQLGWVSTAALGLGLTTFVVPLVQISALLWVLAFARSGRRAPAFERLMRLLKELRAWSMTEVFLLGALVTIVKLSHWVPIEVGVGLWSLAGLTFLLAWLGRFDPQYWWKLAEAGQR